MVWTGLKDEGLNARGIFLTIKFGGGGHNFKILYSFTVEMDHGHFVLHHPEFNTYHFASSSPETQVHEGTLRNNVTVM
jgi:hypothetical protein